MNKTAKTILISGIYALGYWGFAFIIDRTPYGFMDSFLGRIIAFLLDSYTVTYAVITVIVFCRKKCFEKMTHIIIFALASILFNAVIFLGILGIGFDWDVLYFFCSSVAATFISAAIYLIQSISAGRKHEIVKTILVSGIYALGYWEYYFIIDALVPRWYKVDFWGEPMIILPITYALITVIILYYIKCFEKMTHIIIFALASELFNIAIYCFQCVFLYVDGFGTTYNFYASEKALTPP